MATMKASPKEPSFFKLIQPGFKQEINIPKDFLKLYLKRHDQYEHAILRRADKEWRVKLNGRRLGDGWEKFAEQNNLQEGDMLVLKHEGDMKFEVIIFDLNNQCEKEEQQKAQNVEETSQKSKFKERSSPNIKSSTLAEPRKSKSGRLLKRKNYEYPALEVVTQDKPFVKSSHNLKSSPLAEPRKSKSGRLLKRKNYEYPALEVVTHDKPFEKSSHNIKSSPLAEPPKSKSGRLLKGKNFEDSTLEVVTHDKPFDKANHNINSSPLAKASISKSAEFPQRQDFKDQTVEVVTHKIFDKPNHNIKSSILAESSKSKSGGLPQRQDFIDRTLEVVTHKPIDKSNHNIKSSSLAEPPKFMSGGLPQKQNFEDRTLEVVTHKPLDESNHNIKSSPLAETSKSKSGRLPQKQNYEDQTLGVVTHKSSDKPNHNIKLSREASPLTEVVAHKSYGHCHLVCTVRPYRLVRDTMLIPEEFALANGLFNIKKSELIIIDEKGRSWNVILRAYSTCVLIKDGWDKICDANCLKEGDHIMFEVVRDGNKSIWKLHGKISEEDASIIQEDGLNNEIVSD